MRTLQQLGMPLYQCQPPTGYKDTAEAWVNTGALVGRMNFAVALAANRLPGTIVASQRAAGGPRTHARRPGVSAEVSCRTCESLRP